MGHYIIDNVCDYIENTETEVLMQRFENSFAKWRATGELSFRFCYLEYFYARKDWKRFFLHLIDGKRIGEEFKHEMLPAFYNSGEIAPRFDSCLNDLKTHISLVRELNFADEKSYSVLYTILMYRLTGIKEFLFKEIDDAKHMYFDPKIIPFFRADWNRYYVDCGAYIGDSIKNLIETTKTGIKKIFAFEPQEDNYKMLAKNMKKYGSLVTLIYGACGSEGGCQLLSGDGQGGHVISGDDENVWKCIVKTIDCETGRKATFIKMDIEGFEKEALEGAKETIRSSKPVMALSVYHKMEDIYHIQSWINDLKLGYRFILRHYGNTISEVVLYCF